MFSSFDGSFIYSIFYIIRILFKKNDSYVLTAIKKIFNLVQNNYY